MAEFAVIKTGGKQYMVRPGQKIKVEKLLTKEGEEVIFNEVLLVDNSTKTEFGTPNITGAKVKGKLLKQAKAKKVIVFKFKAKKREKTKKGHRQPYSEVEILKIETK